MRISLTLGVITAVFVFCVLAANTAPVTAKTMTLEDRKLEAWEAYQAGWKAGVAHENERMIKGIDAILAERDRAAVNREKKSDRLPMPGEVK